MTAEEASRTLLEEERGSVRRTDTYVDQTEGLCVLRSLSGQAS